jgi:hypothetical protein
MRPAALGDKFARMGFSRWARCSTLGLSLGFAGCGDDGSKTPAGGFDQTVTCGLRIGVSGEISEQVTEQDSVACATQFGSESGIAVAFLQQQSAALHFVGLQIQGVTRGQTGSTLPTTVLITNRDKTRDWSTSDCSVAVTAQTDQGAREFGHAFRMEGKGSCASPAKAASGGQLVIAPFGFVTTVTWPN